MVNMQGLKQALNNFFNSADFKAGVVSSTKASWENSGYSVELFENGSFRVEWDSLIGDGYNSPGLIISLPALSGEYYNELVQDGWEQDDIWAELWLNDLAEIKERVQEAFDSWVESLRQIEVQ